MTVYFEDLDDSRTCFVVPLYRNTFVEQPLVGSVTVQDQNLMNDMRKSLGHFFNGFLGVGWATF
jgi:hypothetical protein